MGKGGETLVFWESCLDMASLGATGGLGADSIEMQDGNIGLRREAKEVGGQQGSVQRRPA